MIKPDGFDDEAGKKLGKLFAKFLKKLGKKAAKALKREYEKLAKADSIDEIIDALDTDGFAVLINPTEKILYESYNRAGAKAIGKLKFGMSDDETAALLEQVDERALAYAEARAAELVGMTYDELGELVPSANAEYAITEATREMLRATTREAVDSGMSAADFANEIEENYAFSEERAMTVARTELAFAHVEGNMAAYDESGIVTMKRSVLGSEHDVPDECNTNAAEGWIPFDQPFGSGDDAPPYHPNCVCDVEVQVSEPSESEDGTSDISDENS